MRKKTSLPMHRYYNSIKNNLDVDQLLAYISQLANDKQRSFIKIDM